MSGSCLLSRVTYQTNAAKKTRPSTTDPRSHGIGDGRAYHSNALSANQRTQLKMSSRCLSGRNSAPLSGPFVLTFKLLPLKLLFWLAGKCA